MKLLKKAIIKMKTIERKIQTIKKVVEGNMPKNKAAKKLNCTVRNINLLIKKYNQQKDDPQLFVHQNTGQVSKRKFPTQFIQKIIDLYQTTYQGFNYKHFKEQLKNDHKILISYTKLHQLLINQKLYSQRLQEKTKTRLKKQLKSFLETSTLTEAEILINEKAIEMLNQSHPMQNRKECFGERIQMDASFHYWIKDEKWALHGAIDDATGKIVGLFFDKQETLNGYYHMSKQFLLKYGTPFEILTDKRTVFYSTKKESGSTDSFTQYGFMCHNFDIELNTTSIPQTKGRIERLWSTLQDRLPKHLQLNHITNIEDANTFLLSYLEQFNQQFALNDPNIKSMFTLLTNEEKANIDFILGIRVERKINHGSAIKFNNKYYLCYENERLVNFAAKTSIFVVQTLNGELYANHFGQWLDLVEVNQNSTYQNNAKSKVKKPQANRIIKESPWKYSNWLMYKSTLKQNNFGK